MCLRRRKIGGVFSRSSVYNLLNMFNNMFRRAFRGVVTPFLAPYKNKFEVHKNKFEVKNGLIKTNLRFIKTTVVFINLLLYHKNIYKGGFYMSNEVVKHHNDLNTIPMRKWSKEEMDFFFAIIAKLRDEGTKEITFNKRSLAELANYSIRTNKAYEQVIDQLSNLKQAQ